LIARGLGKQHGEVDLYGYVQSPILTDRKKRLQKEQDQVSSIETGFTPFTDESEQDHLPDTETVQDITDKTCTCISLLSHRSKELRELKLKKEIALTNMKESVGPHYEKSKYAFVISLLQTTLFRLKDTVNRILGLVNKLCEISADLNQTSNNFCAGHVVDLNKQSNYACPLSCAEEISAESGMDPVIFSHLIPQRTPTWKGIRESVKVTGSNLYKAFDCETLKAQRQYFEQTVKGKKPEEPSEAAKVAMQHGTENEVHALGTLVGKILPVIEPTCKFHEEGCYVLQAKDKPFMAVSPDGSVRKPDGEVRYAVELKCPLPGKKFQVDVQYSVPERYIPQLLAEMYVLQRNELLYLSYTPESATLHIVKFDENLWRKFLQ
jgi:hypothetical protein